MIANFETSTYTLFHDSIKGFVLDMSHKQVVLSFCQLLALRQKLMQLTTTASLEALIHGDNYVLLFMADKSHLVYLSTTQLLELKRVVASAFKSVPSY